MFRGEFNHQIDAKNRIRIPAKLRSELGDNYVFAKGTEKCLFVFTEDKFNKLSESLDSASPYDRLMGQAFRKLLPSCYTAEEDNQGRVVLPQNLINYAELGKDITIIGMGNKLEIWDTAHWNKINSDENLEESFEMISKVFKDSQTKM